MTIKRSKCRRGPFIHEQIKVDTTGEITEEKIEAITEIFTAASPANQVKKWQVHAERLGVGVELLKKAESLIDSRGHVPAADWDRFQHLLIKVQSDVEAVQTEETLIPEVAKRQRQLHAPKNKKNRFLMKACQQLYVQKGKRARTADALFKRFPLRANALVIDGAQLYRENTEQRGDKVFCISPDGKIKEWGTRAFANYFAEVKKD